MEQIALYIAIALGIICIILGITLWLYRRQINSLSKQLEFHAREDSQTDIWLDVMKGPFQRLQEALNAFMKKNRNEKQQHRQQEQAWKELVANVSHDIRTPITSVSGYFQLFLETEDPEKRARYAEIITGRLGSFQTMLEDFFAYATVNSDDRRLELEKIDLKRLTGESLFLYYEEIEKKLGSPAIHFPDEELFVMADVEYTKRIIQNIIKNALTHGCGEFEITINEEKDKKVSLSFANRTQEILPEDVSMVFERTARLDAARSTQGTGLGLCIVKELAEKMGAEVLAERAGDYLFSITIHFPQMK